MDGSALGALQIALTGFALMAAISMLCALLIRLIVIGLARSRRAPAAPAPEFVMPVRDDRAAVAAAIAAAVHIAMPRHRVLRIDPARQSADWTREARARQHGAHTPRR
ncbi:MAG: hypothetical protein ACFCUS_12935 [Rubrimonas sp.]|uniref:hypothetical protein n=1 Tax=Rubrimonas sp. TaxID=2036015 RepID=UPI002FDD283C